MERIEIAGQTLTGDLFVLPFVTDIARCIAAGSSIIAGCLDCYTTALLTMREAGGVGGDPDDGVMFKPTTIWTKWVSDQL